jgi:tetratricopeptide (TPR) repeat protein
MAEQLSLFVEENILFNTGIQQLLEMDFSSCLETLEHYRKLFPWGRDVSREVAVASFWKERLDQTAWTRVEPHEIERRYQVWLEFEDTFARPWKRGSIEEQLQVRYFSRLSDALAAGVNLKMLALSDATPVGLIYLLAGRSDAAMTSLQNLIAAEPENARAYGYLGDAYLLRGDVRTGRLCYREAFVIAPGQVDLIRLQDEELKKRLAEEEQDESSNGDFLEWFSVKAQLEGFFERRVFRDLDDLQHWLYRYLDLEKTFGKRRDSALVPRLFYHAMVLSDNASMMRFIKKVDLSEIRRRMLEWHPDLFARHMRVLGGTRSQPFRLQP